MVLPWYHLQRHLVGLRRRSRYCVPKLETKCYSGKYVSQIEKPLVVFCVILTSLPIASDSWLAEGVRLPSYNDPRNELAD